MQEEDLPTEKMATPRQPSTSSTIGGSSPLEFVVHPLPGSAEQLADRLREVGDRLRVHPSLRPGPLLPPLHGNSGGPILNASQIEVGPSHFAFLLNDGRLCRLPFSVISDRLDLSKTSGGPGGPTISLGGQGGSGGGGSGKST